ncbi:MAG TPA: iron chelate uptake ABC transporter family permease subunit, partial [Actinomycetales bacterium]
PRAAAVTVIVVLLALFVAALGVSVGDYVVPLPDVLRALLGEGERGAVLVVQSLRLPRALTGLLVGAAFGLAGALTQSVARNPLASPDVVGLTAGASAAAVTVIVLGLPVPVPLAALVGALTVAGLILALTWRSGFSGPRLILIGIGLGACSIALTDYLLVRGNIEDAQRATIWLTGSLNGRGWEHVRPVAIALALLLPLALALGRRLTTLSLGDDVARGLGTRVNRDRVLLVLVAVGLAGVATAAAGPVAFVGLVAPQVAVRLAGTPGIPLAASAACGALLVVAADLVARTAFGALLGTSVELPVGAVTALVGAPVLLWLLRRSLRGKIT